MKFGVKRNTRVTIKKSELKALSTLKRIASDTPDINPRVRKSC